MAYPQTLYQAAEPIMYQPVETTKATYVDSYEGVLEMLEELKKAKEIAVDLEHHDFRTYVGLVSLMQISTRDKDWIVDTLRPWRQKLEVLNEVFADPKIVKVRIHGIELFGILTMLGFPWCIHGYDLVAARFGSLREWSF
jgi:exosome complex exonuclease RRP6